MIRRTPTSTLFPYTTLFRSFRSSRLASSNGPISLMVVRNGWPRSPRISQNTTGTAAGRSEEHTSELQSRPHLVCRLLLEKKKNKDKLKIPHTPLPCIYNHVN